MASRSSRWASARVVVRVRARIWVRVRVRMWVRVRVRMWVRVRVSVRVPWFWRRAAAGGPRRA